MPVMHRVALASLCLFALAAGPSFAAEQASPKSSDAKPTSTDAKTTPTDTKTAATFTSLTSEVTGGFAGVQQKMTIDADGKFKITETRPAKTIEGQLTKAELADLTKRAAAVDWKSVQAKYVNPQVADAFMVTLTVTVGEKTEKTLVSDPAPQKTPAALAALLKQVRDLRQKHLQDAKKVEEK